MDNLNQYLDNDIYENGDKSITTFVLGEDRDNKKFNPLTYTYVLETDNLQKFDKEIKEKDYSKCGRVLLENFIDI